MWKRGACVASVRGMPNMTLYMPKPLLDAVAKARKEHGFNASLVCRTAIQSELNKLLRDTKRYSAESPVLKKLEDLSDRVSRLEGVADTG